MVVLFPWGGQAYQEYQIGEVKVNSSSRFTRIFIQIPRGTGYVVRELTDPPRILLNLYPANLAPPYREIGVSDEFVQRIRLSKDSKNVVKVVIDLNTSSYSFDVSFQKEAGAVVVEIKPSQKDVIFELLKKEEDLLLTSRPESRERGKGIFRIVIDPGHGGKDPGAIGPSGLKEKDVTLKVARRVTELLKKNLAVEVLLTRNGDEFVPLDKRTEIANLVGGDLFVSIHCNAAWDGRVAGIETFYNSQYVYGEGAEEVAARENAAFASESLPSRIKNIIWDLIQNQYRSESEALSRIVQEKLAKNTRMLNRGVKSAQFYVLRGIAMPAILVEVGFISNPWEERKLKEPQFQELVALGIYEGLATYINSFNRKASQ
jgi:N-acetylmuramoyl-L-alanine amidase